MSGLSLRKARRRAGLIHMRSTSKIFVRSIERYCLSFSMPHVVTRKNSDGTFHGDALNQAPVQLEKGSWLFANRRVRIAPHLSFHWTK